MALKLPLFLARHPRAIPAIRANSAALRPPASYAESTFYPIHAFRWVGGAGDEAGVWVRYKFVPRTGASANAPAKDQRSREYLVEEVRSRLPEEPIHFDLELQIAGEGDDPHDPMSQWGADRPRVIAGTVEITAVADDADPIVFDPMRLTDGIEPSDDPILRFRPAAYSRSFENRAGAGGS